MKISVIRDNIDSKAVKCVDTSFLQVKKIRQDIISEVISWQRSNKRYSIASTKNVASVSGSTRKLYSQKGTGNARHGSKKRNLFRGGAVTFGPHSGIKHKFSLNKKIRKIALKHSLCSKIHNNALILYENLLSSTNKTKDFIKKYSLDCKSRVMFLDLQFDRNFFLSCRNIPNVSVLQIAGINVYDIMISDYLYFSLKAFSKLEEVIKC